MKKFMLSRLVKDNKGFTLIELLSVMAIIGVLAAILTPIASQSGESARDAQIRQDAGTIEGVVGTVFSERSADTGFIESESVTVTADINTDPPSTTTQEKSSLYPELFITEEGAGTSTSVYTSEFPTSGSATDGVVVDLILVDEDGNTLISRSDLLEGYTALDFDDLLSEGFITEIPESVTSVSTINLSYHSALWLLKKATSAGGEDDDARSVVVMKLLSVTLNEGTDTVILSYGRIH